MREFLRTGLLTTLFILAMGGLFAFFSWLLRSTTVASIVTPLVVGTALILHDRRVR